MRLSKWTDHLTKRGPQPILIFMKKTLAPRRQQSFADLISVLKPKKIVELGSYKGQSIVAMLQYAKELNSYPNALCIDTWLGSIEHWNNKYPHGEFNFDSLLLTNGEPSLLGEFWSLVDEFNFRDQVEILRCPTYFAVWHLSNSWFDTNLVYIDADHATKSVIRDLVICTNSMPEATLSGDDFSWKSVRLALVIHLLKHPRKWKLFVSQNCNTWVLVETRSLHRKMFENLKWSRQRIFFLCLVSTYDWLRNRYREMLSGVLSKSTET